MKYLKSINENKNVEELTKFCGDYLAYLLDNNDYKLQISENTKRIDRDYRFNNSAVYSEVYPEDTKKTYTYYTIKLLPVNFPYIIWDDVKDYYIPFLQIISNKINIFKGVKFICNYRIELNFSIEELINDDVDGIDDIDGDIYEISFNLMKNDLDNI